MICFPSFFTDYTVSLSLNSHDNLKRVRLRFLAVEVVFEKAKLDKNTIEC